MKGEIDTKYCTQYLSDMFETQYPIEDGMLPRSKNERADKLSRIVDKDDWFDSDEFFFSILTLSGILI